MVKKIEITPLDKKTLAKIKVGSGEITNDFFDYSKVVVKKPWGYEYLIFQNKDVAVWILYLKPGAQTSMHCHPHKVTSLVVLEGKAICSTLHEKVQREAGEGLMIEKGVFHQTTVISDNGAFVMEIESPVNKRDLVRLKDQYGRAKEGYETIDKNSFIPNYNYLTLTEPEIYYNVSKRFGPCTITIKKFNNSGDLNEFFGLSDKDVLCILSGTLSDSTGKIIGGPAATMQISDLKTKKPLKLNGELVSLIIKRKDNIVKVSDYIMTLLKEQGAKEVFFVPGDANVHLLDSLGRNGELNFTCCQTERVAAMAAEAYSKLTSNFGVIIISSGASGTNTITGVANAWVDSVPLIVLSGQATLDPQNSEETRQLGNKSLGIVDIVKPITKYSVKITNPEEIRFHLEKAAFLAKTSRPGPVWIDIPIDIQGMMVDTEKLNFFSHEKIAETPDVLLENQILEVIGLLKKAKRPVILAGRGIRVSKNEKELLKLIELLKIPLLTSRGGADLISESHPLFFGRPGAYGQRRANFIIQNSDLLISIGARLSIPQIGRNYKAFARAAKKIIVDIDRAELEKETIKADISINSSAGKFILALISSLKSSDYKPKFSEWLAKCEKWRNNFNPISVEKYSHRKFINPYLFVSAISDSLGKNETIVADGGAALNYAMQTFKFKENQRMIVSSGIELPGFAVAGSIGASVGNNRGEIICLCEDRGFQLNIPELQTIIDNKLPIKIFILKGKGHSDIRKIQKEYFGGRFVGTDEILFGSPDLAKIGKVYKFSTFAIKKPSDLKTQIKKILKYKGPVICEIQTDKEQEMIPRIVFTVKPDGKWEAKPLEDMYPFLDRKLLKENMLIPLLEGEVKND